MEEIINGCYGDGAKPTDFILTEGIIDDMPVLYQQDDIRYEYNQGNQDWSKQSCTVFQAIGALSDLNNYKFPLSEIKEYDELSYSKNEFQENPVRLRGHGRWVQYAVEMCCKKWNHDHPDMQVAFFRLDMDDDVKIEKVIDKNYNICTGFYGNVKRQNDYYYDAILDGTYFGAESYGHAINVVKNKGKMSIKDNYEGRTGKNKIPTNYYELAHLCSEISHIHNYGYVYTKVKENNLAELKKQEKMKVLINQAMSAHSELYNLTSDKQYQKDLHDMNNKHRPKLATVEEILSKLQ